MDSVTQITLGAALGHATLGRQIGYRAALWGGICGTLPDLDNFIPYQDAVATVTFHRSFSHSLLVLALLAPLLAWLIGRLHPQTREYQRRWLALVLLVFTTHVLLDALTVYGTQLLWPLLEYPVSWSTVFIIDPAYTLPLLVGVIAALSLRRRPLLGHYLNLAGLALSTLYLAWTVGAKFYVETQAKESLREQGIEYSRMLSTPTPFNSILWRLLVMDAHGYYEGYYSVLDADNDIRWTHYPDNKALLDGMEDAWAVRRLRWFTHGFYSVQRSGDDIFITDLRMGMEPAYPFRYKVAETGNPHARPVPGTLVPSAWRGDQLPWLWRRLTRPRS